MFLRSGWEVNMLKPEADQVGDFVGVQLHSQDDVPWRPWQNFEMQTTDPVWTVFSDFSELQT